MNMIPMGEYYLWHCDWCDSTNYTLWSRLDADGLACAACHHHPAGNGTVLPGRNGYPLRGSSRPVNTPGIAC